MIQLRQQIWLLVLPLLMIWGATMASIPATAGQHLDFKTKVEMARHGDANNYFTLGMAYLQGEEVAQDYQQALIWLRKAANYHNSDAQFQLGIMYKRGEGVTQDYNQARTWLRLAEEQGHKTAKSHLRQIETELADLKSAAEDGSAEAQVTLAELYATGNGVPQSNEQAAACLQKSAAQGNPQAQYRLGLAHAAGKGVPRDDAQALAWHRKASAQNHAPAKYALSGIYFNGKGVERDRVQGYAWLSLAADQGDDNAIANEKFAAGMLTPKELTQAEALADELQATIDKQTK